MAKFKSSHLKLKTDQRAYFGDADQAWFSYTTTSGQGTDLTVNVPIAGEQATADYHLARYDQLTSLSGVLAGQIVTDHGNLTGLGDDDHPQYILVDGSRGFTSTVSGVYPVQDYDLATKEYVDYVTSTISGGTFDHGSLTGLLDDDHPQYILVDGTRAFTGTVSGIDPTEDAHLTTKFYVDSSIATASGYLQSQFDNLDVTYATDAELAAVSGSLQTQITTYSDHGNLSGLTDDDHPQYVLVDGTRGFTGTVSGIDPVASYDLTTKNYVDGEISTLSGSLSSQIVTDHGALTGLTDDDHPQYLLRTDFTTYSGAIVSQIPTDFYTQSEVDNIITTTSGDIIDYVDEAVGTIYFGNSTLYFHENDSDIAGYDLMLGLPSDHAESYVEMSVTQAEGEKLMAEYTTASGTPNSTVIPGGTWMWHLWAHINASAGTTNLIAKFYKRSMGGDETSLFDITSPDIDAFSGYGHYDTQATISGIAMDITDRLVVKIYAVTDVSAGRTITYYIEGADHASRIDTTFTEAALLSHSQLSGLDNDDHTQYLNTTRGDARYYKKAEVDNLITTASGDIVSQIPSLSGYATESYVDNSITTASGDIVSQIPSLSGYATEAYVTTVSGDIVAQIPTDFYTQSQVDNLIAAASGTTDHSLLDNLDYASAGHTGFQPAGDYITDAEMTTISGDIVAQIPSLTGYATESYVDNSITTTSGDIVAQIPTDFYTQSEVDNLISTISGAEPESLYYDGSPIATADANGISTQRISDGDNWISFDDANDRVEIYSNGKLIIQIDNITTLHHANDGTKALEISSSFIDFFGATAARRFQIYPHDTLTRLYNVTKSCEMVLQSNNSSSETIDMLRLDPDEGAIVPADSFMYFGSPTVSGSWRMGISGEDFIHQKFNGLTWETKQTIVG